MTTLRARTLRHAALAVCLLGLAGVARGQVQVGTNVVVALTTNQTLYATGDLFELGRTLDLVRPSAEAQGDVYVRMQDPAGQVMYLGGDPGQFVESPIPGAGAVRSAPAPDFRADPWPLDRVPGLSGKVTVRPPAVRVPLPGGLPTGTYTFEATFVRSGGDPRDPAAIITASVPISVALGAPSRLGNSAIRVTSKVVGIASNPRANSAAVARNPGILSVVSLATERVVFSTTLLDPADAALGRGVEWGGSQGAVAVNPETNVAVVTNAQPVYRDLPGITPSVWVVSASSGQVIARRELDFSPAIADPTRVSPRRCSFFFTVNNTATNPNLAVRPLAINSRTNTAVVASVTQAQPEQTTLYLIDPATATIVRRRTVEPRINSIAIDEVRNRLIGIRVEDLYVLDLGDFSTARSVPFPAGLEPFCGASRTLAILPDTGEVVVTGASLQPGGGTLGAVTLIDVDRGQASAPVEIPNSVGALDPVLVPSTRTVLVTAPASGFTRLALVNLDQRRMDAVFETSISLPTVTLSPANDAVLLSGDADNLLVLRPGGSASTRLVGALRVRVRNAATGASVDGATIVVDGAGLAVVTSPSIPADFAAVPPGPQSVTASAAGFDPQTLSVTIEAGRTREITVSLLPGGALVPLRGRILVEGGSGASAQALLGAPGPFTRQALGGQPGVTIRIPGTNLQVVSAADGTFRIEQAPVGTFLVNATAAGLLGAQEIVPIRRDADNQLILTLLRTLGG